MRVVQPSSSLFLCCCLFLHSCNKKQLIKLICDDLQDDKDFMHHGHTLFITGQEKTVEITSGNIIERQEMYTTHEEADNIVVQQAFLAASMGASGVAVVADDTDVWALLLHYYMEQRVAIPFIMKSPINGRSVIDIKQTSLKYAELIPNLLAAHSLSGCDTVSGFFGIGKKTVLHILREGYSLSLLGDVTAPWHDVVEQPLNLP